MSWTPKYSGNANQPMGVKLIGAIRDNVLSIIKTDEADALAYVNGGTPLSPIKQYAKARRVNTQYPFLGVFPVATEPNEAEANFRPRHELAIEIALLNSDPEALSVLLEKYVLAVFLLIESATVAQMTAGLSSHKGNAFWTVERIDFSQTLQYEIQQSQYLQIAQLQLAVTVTEQ